MDETLVTVDLKEYFVIKKEGVGLGHVQHEKGKETYRILKKKLLTCKIYYVTPL